jgi:hypothetical protein
MLFPIRGNAGSVLVHPHNGCIYHLHRGPEDAVEDPPVVHTRHTAWLVRKNRPDDVPLMVTEFIAHDSRLQFGSLNHIRADTFNSKPPCREWPSDRTYGRSCQIDAIDPKQPYVALQRRPYLGGKRPFATSGTNDQVGTISCPLASDDPHGEASVRAGNCIRTPYSMKKCCRQE